MYKRASRKQVDKIKSLAEKKGISLEEINKLSAKQAAQLISSLEQKKVI